MIRKVKLGWWNRRWISKRGLLWAFHRPGKTGTIMIIVNSLRPQMSHSDINHDCCCFVLVIKSVTCIYSVANWIQRGYSKAGSSTRDSVFHLQIIYRSYDITFFVHSQVHSKGTVICLLQEMFLVVCIPLQYNQKIYLMPWQRYVVIICYNCL